MQNRQDLFRILDAECNRASEGLRVVEDYVRFVLEDQYLVQQLKDIRHELQRSFQTIDRSERVAARDTLGDIGTSVTTATERSRKDLLQVARASLQRTEQALRSLEEFGKLLQGHFGVSIESLRYRLYTVDKAIEATVRGQARMDGAKLYVLIDGGPTADAFVRAVDQLVEANVHVLQLRDKKLSDRELLTRAVLLRKRTAGRGTLAIVNDRPDIAAIAHVDGVHLGQEELTVRDARHVLAPEQIIGISTHTIQQARQAVLDGATYIGVGPVFPSQTKTFSSHVGVELLRKVSAEIALPAFAIGGINGQNLPSVMEAGFTRIAVSAAVTSADNPALAARALLKQLTPPREG